MELAFMWPMETTNWEARNMICQMVLSAMKTIKQGQRIGHARLGAVCEGFTEKVTFGKRSVIGDRSSQEGNIWRENIPDRRKIKGKGPEVGTCLMSLSYDKVTSVTGVK